MLAAQHEFQGAAGQMQDAARPAAPQHLDLRAWLHAHGQQATAQLGMAGQLLHQHRSAIGHTRERNHSSLPLAKPYGHRQRN